MAAVAQDMKKPGEEVYFTDLRYADHEIGHAIRHLEDWMKPTILKTVSSGLNLTHLNSFNSFNSSKLILILSSFTKALLSP